MFYLWTTLCIYLSGVVAIIPIAWDLESHEPRLFNRCGITVMAALVWPAFWVAMIIDLFRKEE